MFSSSSAPVVEGLVYNFDDEENVLKWKGLFVSSLHKVTWIYLPICSSVCDLHLPFYIA